MDTNAPAVVITDQLENYDLSDLYEDEDVMSLANAVEMTSNTEMSISGGAGSSSDGALPGARLTQLVNLIENRRTWKINEAPEHDAALLLWNRKDPHLANVPRRAEANRVMATGACVFFVEKPSVPPGKKRKDEATSTELHGAEGVEWIEATSTSASGGSITPCGIAGAEHVGVLRKSGGVREDMREIYGNKVIGHYCLIRFKDHPSWDAGAKVETAGRGNAPFQYLFSPKGWLVHCMPDGAQDGAQLTLTQTMSERIADLEVAVYDDHEPRLQRVEAHASIASISMTLKSRALEILTTASCGQPMDKLQVRRQLQDQTGETVHANEANKALYALLRDGLIQQLPPLSDSNKPRWVAIFE